MKDKRLPGNEEIEQTFEDLYEHFFDLLATIAIRKFRVPETDAESLVHEVFLSYFRKMDQVKQPYSWLLGAICNASRYYWRQHGRSLEEEETFEQPAIPEILDSFADRLAVRQALLALRPQERDILRMRYREGRSVDEIGQRLGVEAKEAEKLLTKFLGRVRSNLPQSVHLTRGSLALQPETSELPEGENWRESEELREVLTHFIEAYRNL